MQGNGPFEGSPRIQLPSDRPATKVHGFQGEAHSFKLAAETRRLLDGFQQREGTTSFITLLAAFAALLRRYGNEEEVLLATPSGVTPSIFAAPRVLRLDLRNKITFRALLEWAGTVSGGPTMPATGTTDFDLLFGVKDGDGCVVTLGYNAGQFDRESMVRVAGHYQVLLESLLQQPDAPLEHQPLLSDSERHTLVESWNRTEADYPRNVSVARLFEMQVARTPERVAVIAGDDQLTYVTYSTLNARANQLARHLRDLGVHPGVNVGLCINRSADMVVGLLGILKAGGAYVPLDPDFPRDRLEHYMQDSQAPVLVTQPQTRNKLPVQAKTVVTLDTAERRLDPWPTENLDPLTAPDDVAYVIYTSGSTGKPKGVQVLHDGLNNFLHAMQRQLGMTAEDVLLAVTTLSFDMHVTELWLPLLVGARVVIARRNVAADGTALAAILERSDATFFQATPATYRLLFATGWKGKADLTAITGGEALSAELAAQMLRAVKTVWNGYGPTETTVYSTMHRVTDAGRAIPIGRPIDNTRIYLLDGNLEPVPIGLPGEVYLAGAGLARGYLHRPDLSAERFIANPFRAGERIYKTGDLGRYRPDGVIDYLGRLDHQVKVRGFRVELGEVEAALAQHPGVRSNVVLAQHADAGDILAAYLVPQNGRDVDVSDLRRHLRATLPDYMIPARFTVIDEWPLSPNGKIDRQALARSSGSARGSRPLMAPRNDIERALLAIWEEVLPVKPIGITDNFFDLGGHSLHAALIMNQVKEKLGHTLPLGMIFEAGTLQRMAARLQHQLEAGSESCLVPLHTRGSQPPLFLIAGVGGHVFTFHKFARLLGADQPSYGVKAIGVDGSQTPPHRLEDIAARYLEEILAVRPTGPYVVGGYSIGALIAYELAIQMQKRGLTVGPLVVFDRPAPGHPIPLPLPRRLWMHIRNFFKATPGQRCDYLFERLRNLRDRILFTLGLGKYVAPEIEGVHALPQRHLRRVWGALQTAQHRYRPRERFEGGVMLFQSEDVPDWNMLVRQEPYLGWSQWARGPIETIMVPGGHLDMFHDRNIDRLASALRKGIHRWAASAPRVSPSRLHVV